MQCLMLVDDEPVSLGLLSRALAWLCKKMEI